MSNEAFLIIQKKSDKCCGFCLWFWSLILYIYQKGSFIPGFRKQIVLKVKAPLICPNGTYCKAHLKSSVAFCKDRMQQSFSGVLADMKNTGLILKLNYQPWLILLASIL